MFIHTLSSKLNIDFLLLFRLLLREYSDNGIDLLSLGSSLLIGKDFLFASFQCLCYKCSKFVILDQLFLDAIV